MDDWANQLKWNAIAYAVVVVAAFALLLGLWIFVPNLRRSWLPLPRLRPGTWTGLDVFLAFCVLQGFQLLLAELLLWMGFFKTALGPGPDMDSPELERILYALRSRSLSSPLTLTVILGVVFAMMYARSGSRPHHYGMTSARWPANLGLGLIAFVLCQPVILGGFALLLLVFPQHFDPFRVFGKSSPPQWEWAFLAFQTTVAAPLLEEIFCRGILLGWLRRASLSGHLTLVSITLFVAIFTRGSDFSRLDEKAEAVEQAEAGKKADPRSFEIAPAVFGVVMAAGYGFALYRLGRHFGLTEAEVQSWRTSPSTPPLTGSAIISEEHMRELHLRIREADDDRSRRWAYANGRLAVFGSALLWAVLHPWPHALALFPMGLVLGWLAYRTQSLIGPIVFHVLFNLSTFIALYGSSLSPAP